MDRPAVVTLRALGLGDLLTAVPALRGLARAFPEHRKVLAAPKYLGPIAELTGAVDEVIDTAPLGPLDASLAHPDVAVNMHGEGPKSHVLLLDLSPRRFISFGHPEIAKTRGFPQWRHDEHEVHRWCRLLNEFGISADSSDLDLPNPSLGSAGELAGATVLHPGAKDPERRWPPERWVDVARAESAAGRTVVLTGSLDEEALAGRVAQESGLAQSAVLAGKTDLLQLAAVVGAARVVVSADTGVAHLATALRTPSVVLFGQISPAEWGPPPDRPRHRALWKGPRPDASAAELLADIQVEEVLEAIWGVAREGASREIVAPSGAGRAVSLGTREGEQAG